MWSQKVQRSKFLAGATAANLEATQVAENTGR